MRSKRKYFSLGRMIGAVVLLGVIASGASGCYDGGGYGWGGDYPSYGYAPYAYGWGGWGYSPGFDVHHSWEGHYAGEGHHTEFYHGGGGGVAHVGGGGVGGFHGGSGGGAHSGGGGGHSGGGGGHR